MKITKQDLAEILAELSWKRYSIGFSWDKLPYHKQLTFIAEAERLIKAVRILKQRKSPNLFTSVGGILRRQQEELNQEKGGYVITNPKLEEHIKEKVNESRKSKKD